MIQSVLDFDLKRLFSEKSLYFLTFAVIFAISLLNKWLLITWLIITPVFFIFKYGVNDGFLMTLLVYQFRQMCNNQDLCIPITTVPIGQLIYYIVIIVSSFYFILHVNTEKIDRGIFYLLVLFSVYAALSSFVNSSYPIVALFKIILYAIPFIGTICGVSNSKRTDWVNLIFILLCSFMTLNLIFISNNDAYLHSKLELFRGLSAHSNQLGFLCVLFQAIIWTKYNNIDLSTIIISILNLIILCLTMARGQIIAFLILAVIFLLTCKIDIQKKAMLIIFLMIIAVIFSSRLMDIFIEFMNSKYRTSGSNVFSASRGEQFERIMNQFWNNPLTGTGFNVPFIKGVRDSSFYFSLPTEDGNLFFALLCQTGIIGLVLFTLAYGRIFINGKGTLLFFSPILICISEMTFFSTNNVGLLLYFFYAIFINNGVKELFRGNETLCHRIKLQQIQ